MIAFEIVTKDGIGKAFFVFNWNEGIYEFMTEDNKKRDLRKVLFSGDILYLKEVLKEILNELEKNIKKRW